MKQRTAARAAGSPTAYGRAVAKLARRDHAEAELRRDLARSGHPPAEVDGAVERLKAQRALDDDRFAEALSRSRLGHRGVGSHRVRSELRRRGVAPKVAEAALRRAQAEVSEAAALDAQARRYWKNREAEEPRRRLAKLWAFLLRRGYPADLVGTRLRALWPRFGDALDGLEPAAEDES